MQGQICTTLGALGGESLHKHLLLQCRECGDRKLSEQRWTEKSVAQGAA